MVAFQHLAWSVNLPQSWSCCSEQSVNPEKPGVVLCPSLPLTFPVAAAARCFSCPSPFCCRYAHFDFFKIYLFILNWGFSSFFVSSENNFPYALLDLGLWGRK